MRSFRLVGIVLSAAVVLPSCRRPPRDGGLAAKPSNSVENTDVVHRDPRAPGGRAPVIWVGLDGLDPDFMDRLSSEGKVPNWSRLVSEGAAVRLRSFVPILSPIVWTTIATGVGPDVHRVLDFQEIDPSTGLRVPVSGLSRAVPAVWNTASAAGRKTGVVGWWATHPAEVVDGFFVSDRASPILYSGGTPPSGAAYPPALDARVQSVASRDGDVRAEDLVPYLDASPAEIARSLSSGRGMEDPVVALARILAATRITQRLARDLYDRDRPDLLAVYFEGTDEIGHVFAPETPPRLPCASDAGFARDHRAAETYFGTIDRILGQWMRRAREDGATLIVNSDHGFKWGSDRTCERSSLESSTAAFWHRLDGIFAAWGARVIRDPVRREIHPDMFDVAPTILALLDLPADVRMKGSTIAVFEGLREPPRRRLFETTLVRRVSAAPISEKAASEYARKLEALGYLSGGEESAGPAPSDAAPEIGRPGLTESAYNNLGLYECDVTRDLSTAESSFQKSLAIRPSYASPIFNLAVLYRRKGQDDRARDWLFRSLAAGHADPAGTVLTWAAEDRARGNSADEKALLEKACALYPEKEELGRALADLRFRSHDCPGALEAIVRFQAATNHPETLNELALLDTCLGRRDEAVSLFRRSLALKPNQPRVVEALGMLEGRSGGAR